MFPAPMKQACSEARKWLGATSPNPAVGAVALNADGQILAIASHQRAGSDHAEATLLKICHENTLLAQVHTLCITLEPCNHQGRTPPCTEAIIQSGIKNIIVGARDPNPHVTGGGIERLRQAGLHVTVLDDPECQQLIHAFAYHTQTGKPWVTVKRAFNHEGSMIPALGQKTFTSQSSLSLSHRLRKKADAILTGSGTILADAPLFTVRHVKDYPEKRRWLGILDRRKRVPLSYLEAAKTRGLDALIYRNISEAIADLEAKGAQNILVEAGPLLSSALLDYSFWTMSVNIRQSDIDRIDVEFNRKEPILFEPQHFSWDSVLPNEN